MGPLRHDQFAFPRTGSFGGQVARLFPTSIFVVRFHNLRLRFNNGLTAEAHGLEKSEINYLYKVLGDRAD